MRIKTIFSATVIILLLARSSSAGPDFPCWSIGSSGGFNVAEMYGPGIENLKDDYVVKSRAATNLGVFVDYRPYRYLSLEIGPQMNGKGYNYEDYKIINGMNVTYRIMHKNTCVDFPLVIKPTLPLDGGRLYCLAGMAYSRVIGARREVTADVSYWGHDTTMEISSQDYLRDGVPFALDTLGTREYVPYEDLYRLDDLSLVFGLGYQGTPLSKRIPVCLFFDARYYLGLWDNTRLTARGMQRLDSIYQRLFQFYADNNIDPADMGFGPDDAPKREPIHKFSTIAVSVGLRICF
jgi:hypothetical protein